MADKTFAMRFTTLHVTWLVAATVVIGQQQSQVLEVRTGADLVRGWAGASGPVTLQLANDYTLLTEADFAGFELPIIIRHNMTLRGRAKRWATLNATQTQNKLRMVNGVVLTIRYVVMFELFDDINSGASSRLFTKTLGKDVGTLILEHTAYLMSLCYPPTIAEGFLGVSRTLRPAAFPGNNTYTVSAEIPQGLRDMGGGLKGSDAVGDEAAADGNGGGQLGCTSDTRAPPMRRCWGHVAYCRDFALIGIIFDNARVMSLTGYQAHLLDTYMLCREVLDEQCVLQYTPYGCYQQHISSMAAADALLPPTPLPDDGGGGGSTASSPHSSSKTRTAAVVGGVVGGVAAAAALAAALLAVVWRRRRRRRGLQHAGSKELRTTYDNGVEGCMAGDGSSSCAGPDEEGDEETAGGFKALLHKNAVDTGKDSGSRAGVDAGAASAPAGSAAAASSERAAPSKAKGPGAGGAGAAAGTGTAGASARADDPLAPISSDCELDSDLAVGGRGGGGGGCRHLRTQPGASPASSDLLLPGLDNRLGEEKEPHQQQEGEQDLGGSGYGSQEAGRDVVVTPFTPLRPDLQLWADPEQKLTLLPVVRGKGSYGKVCEGLYGGQRVAVKLVRDVLGVGAPPGVADTVATTFAQEVEVLGRCRHPNVVRLLAACMQPPRFCLVMELMETSLQRLVFGGQTTDRLLPLPKVLYIGCEIARALEYLHPTIVHRDLKPDNVLISSADSPEPIVKVSDFGLSRLRCTVSPTMHPEAGTPSYMAPECFDLYVSCITHHVDIYSWAVIMWTMLAGVEPWAGCGVVEIAYRVTLLDERLPLEETVAYGRCPARLQRLLTRCWNRMPQRRPAAAEVVKEMLLIMQQQERPAAATELDCKDYMASPGSVLSRIREYQGAATTVAAAAAGTTTTTTTAAAAEVATTISAVTITTATASQQQPAEVAREVVPIAASSGNSKRPNLAAAAAAAEAVEAAGAAAPGPAAAPAVVRPAASHIADAGSRDAMSVAVTESTALAQDGAVIAGVNGAVGGGYGDGGGVRAVNRRGLGFAVVVSVHEFARARAAATAAATAAAGDAGNRGGPFGSYVADPIGSADGEVEGWAPTSWFSLELTRNPTAASRTQ